MGLIKAALGAAGGTLADQIGKNFSYCDAIDQDVLAVKGQVSAHPNLPPIAREATTLSPPDPESQSQTDNV